MTSKSIVGLAIVGVIALAIALGYPLALEFTVSSNGDAEIGGSVSTGP